MMLPTEARVLFAGCRLRRETDDDVRSILRPDLDWRAIIQLAAVEKLAAVLARGLRPVGDAVPAGVTAALERFAWLNQLRSVGFEAAARDVVRRLAAEDIPVMLLKGAALGHTVYAAPHERPMNDLDVLLPRDRAQRGWQLMRSAGWTLERDDLDAFYHAHVHLPPLVSPAGTSCILEIHRALVSTDQDIEVPEAELWSAAEPITVGAAGAWTLAPHHQLFHLCLHSAWSHALSKGLARTARDCQLLIAKRAIDWNLFVHLAEERRATSLCFWTLQLSCAIADIAVPNDVLEQLRRRGGVRFVRLIRPLLLAGAFPVNDAAFPSVGARTMLWEAAIRPARMAIGTVRPWQLGVRHFGTQLQPENVGLGPRIRDAGRRLRLWIRFASRMLATRG